MKTLSRLTHWCLDLIFPKYCLGCGQEGSYLCLDCFASLPIFTSANCFICGRRSPSDYACDGCRRKKDSYLSGLLVAADWNNLLLRQIIYEYKYRFVKELADPLAELMINFLQTSQLLNQPASPNQGEASQGGPAGKLVLVPVPLHGRRLAWRGFNQAEILAQKISTHFNFSLAKDILIRSRYTLPQRQITSQKERAANIQNAFALSKNYSRLLSLRATKGSAAISDETAPLKNKILILVDDIATTGATFEDCARALEPLGPEEIWGLVVARG